MHLEVRDTDVGIPEDEAQRLFARFFRASTAQRHTAERSPSRATSASERPSLSTCRYRLSLRLPTILPRR
jgi:hypothetical protein